jgi:hypothetical protein
MTGAGSGEKDSDPIGFECVKLAALFYYIYPAPSALPYAFLCSLNCLSVFPYASCSVVLTQIILRGRKQKDNRLSSLEFIK